MASQAISLTGILQFFGADENTIRKGELKFISGFVLDLRICDFILSAKVRASMKEKSYSVSLTIDGSGGINKATCECPRGNWICSHMAAVAIFANKQRLSKTDLPNSWIARPKKAAKQDQRTVSDLFPHPRPNYRTTSRGVSQEDRQFLYNELSRADSPCPFKWIVGPEPHSEITKDDAVLQPIVIEDALGDFLINKEVFIEKCKVTSQQINWLAENTKEQRNSLLWGKYRRLRLTGSNFGMVIRATDNHMANGKPYAASLFKTLKGEYSLHGKDAIMWGQMHELTAIQACKDETGNTVAPTGLILFPCGYLGCSPDGMIFAKGASPRGPGILEVKCPFKHCNKRIKEILLEELKGKESTKGFYLTTKEELDRDHIYWHQVQGEIAAADVQWADFVVWTLEETKFVHVKKDPYWKEVHLPKLKQFYLNELMPRCYWTTV